SMRRGRPTSHVKFGEATAILAGDALLTFAVELLGGDGVRGRLCRERARAAGASGAVGGQVLDGAEDRPAEEAYLLRMHRRKKGAGLLVVERGLPESRARAQALILAGQVIVGDQRVDKPGALVPADSEVRLKGEAMPYVSRGGLKLKAALEHFGLDVRGKVCA